MAESDRTTISSPPALRDRLKDLRIVDDEPLWKVIERQIEGDDPDADLETVVREAVKACDDGALQYDDVKNAVQAALREELPPEVLQG